MLRMLKATLVASLFTLASQSAQSQQIGTPPDAQIDKDHGWSRGTHCGEEMPVFNAKVGASGKIVSICKHEGGDGESPGLSYRYGALGNAELIYPRYGASYKSFTLRHYVRARTSYLKLEFTNGGFEYVILERFEADESPQTSAFLRIRRLSDSKVVLERQISPTSDPLTLLSVLDLVPNAPFDE